MLQALDSTFREGLSAFLVIAVLLATVRHAVHHGLASAIRWGIGISVITTSIAATLFSMADNQARWEGVLSLIGAGCVVAVGIYVRRVKRRSGYRTGRASLVLALLVTLILITRGSMEIALLLGTMVALVPSADVLSGALLGTALAIAVAWLWLRLTQHLQPRLLLQLTTVFLTVLFLQLLIDGVHELAESSVLPMVQPIHAATEAFSDEGVYGYFAPFLLIAAPLAWWLVAIFFGHGKASDGGVARMDR
jgi:FTR1 family protein